MNDGILLITIVIFIVVFTYGFWVAIDEIHKWRQRRRIIQQIKREEAYMNYVIDGDETHPCCNMSVNHNHALTCPSRRS